MAKWFCLIDGKQLGPIEPARLKQLADSGTLTPQHKLRRDDTAQWHEAGKVNGLFPLPHSHAPTVSASHATTKLPAVKPQAPTPQIDGSGDSINSVVRGKHACQVRPHLYRPTEKKQKEWVRRRKSPSLYA